MDDPLSVITSLAEHLVSIDEKIDRLTQELATANAQRRDLVEQKLPSLFELNNVSELRLSNGKKLVLKTTLFGKLPDEESPLLAAALDYMEKTGASGLLKRGIVIDKGNEEAIKEVLTLLKERKVSFSTKESVHPQTLLKYIRESAATDPEFPRSAFNAVEVTTVDITKQK